MPPEVYFDTNAFSDLFRNRDTPVERKRRDLIRRAVRDNRFRLVTSMWTLEELGGLAERRFPVYREASQFVLRVVNGLFEDTGTLLEREITLGRRLNDKERFISGESERMLASATRRRRDFVLEAYKEHVLRASRQASQSRDHRTTTLARIARVELSVGDPPGTGMQTWCSDLAAVIPDWTESLLADQRKRMGLEPPSGPVPPPPTAVNFVSYSIARICWYLRDRRRVERGDSADAHHYTCACYSDVLVTGDDRLAEIVALVPAAQASPINFDEFMRRYL